jgi:hypothetical protein
MIGNGVFDQVSEIQWTRCHSSRRGGLQLWQGFPWFRLVLKRGMLISVGVSHLAVKHYEKVLQSVQGRMLEDEMVSMVMTLLMI